MDKNTTKPAVKVIKGTKKNNQEPWPCKPMYGM
jgi:hypothetical protein